MILVTGGGGFLGSAIVRQLRARGDAVRILQRHDAVALSKLGVEVVQADLTDQKAVIAAAKDCDAIIHVAAKAGIWGRRQDFFNVNVEGTRHVIEACRHWRIQRLVYTSTPSVVHGGSNVEGIDETAPLSSHFSAPYPASKAEAERLVLGANGSELATVALRPHLIWGPGDPQITARLWARARAGRLRLVGDGSQRVDSVYIDNAAEAHLLALDRLKPGAACAGKAYFITQGEPVAQCELINGLLKAGGLPACEQTISPRLAWLAGAVLEGIWRLLGREDEPPMTRFLAEQLATAHWYDISAARRDLDYVPRVSMEEGLRRLAASRSASTVAG